MYYIGFSSYYSYFYEASFSVTSSSLLSPTGSSSSFYYSGGGGGGAASSSAPSSGAGGGASFLIFRAVLLQAMISLTKMKTLLSSKGFYIISIPNSISAIYV